MNPYDITLGPKGDLLPFVSKRGAVGSSRGQGLVTGKRVPEQQAIDEAGLYHKHMPGAPTKQLVNLSTGRRIFVMQCGFHTYMGSWGVAVTNPSFAKTDEQGRFVLTNVPPETYKLVVWHPYIRSVNEQTITINPKERVEARIVVHAPTGRLYANEVLEHDYVRYSVTEEQQNEIERMIRTQEHEGAGRALAAER